MRSVFVVVVVVDAFIAVRGAVLEVQNHLRGNHRRIASGVQR